MSNAEKALYYKELKRKKKSEKNKNNYMKNRDKYKSKKVTEYSQTKAATIKINQRLKIKEKRNKARDYQRKHRLKQKLDLNQNCKENNHTFSNRMDK